MRQQPKKIGHRYACSDYLEWVECGGERECNELDDNVEVLGALEAT